MNYIVGTSGFFYRERKGIFYPENLKYSDRLQFYAKYFNGLEVNSSFYRLPSKSTINNFKKVDLMYIFKIHRYFTHFKKYDSAFLNEFLNILLPMKENGKLKGLLFQFPSKVKKEQVFNCLDFVREQEKDLYFYVELRNLELIEEFQKTEILKKLNNLKSILVYVDGKFRNNNLIYNWKDLGFKNCYFRFHGRGNQLYNRLYTEKEIKMFVENIIQICNKKEECFLFFNNTVKAQAIKNALYIKRLLNLN